MPHKSCLFFNIFISVNDLVMSDLFTEMGGNAVDWKTIYPSDHAQLWVKRPYVEDGENYYRCSYTAKSCDSSVDFEFDAYRQASMKFGTPKTPSVLIQDQQSRDGSTDTEAFMTDTQVFSKQASKELKVFF